jgi:hypothetical protein
LFPIDFLRPLYTPKPYLPVFCKYLPTTDLLHPTRSLIFLIVWFSFLYASIRPFSGFFLQ